MENADPRGPVVLRLTARATGANGAAFTRRVLFRLDGTLSGPAWKYRILPGRMARRHLRIMRGGPKGAPPQLKRGCR